MKLLILILLLPVLIQAQILTKKDIAPLCLTFASGMFDGGAESLKFHYSEVNRKYNLNDNFWNPALSWKNKYRNGDPSQGEAFTGSTTVFVWTTDGYHLMRGMRNITAMTAISIQIGERQKWWKYLIELATFYISYTIGFNLSYELIF